VFGAAATVALAYSTVKSWRDTPVLNVMFWAVIKLIAIAKPYDCDGNAITRGNLGAIGYDSG